MIQHMKHWRIQPCLTTFIHRGFQMPLKFFTCRLSSPKSTSSVISPLLCPVRELTSSVYFACKLVIGTCWTSPDKTYTERKHYGRRTTVSFASTNHRLKNPLPVRSLCHPSSSLWVRQCTQSRAFGTCTNGLRWFGEGPTMAQIMPDDEYSIIDFFSIFYILRGKFGRDSNGAIPCM